MKKRANLAQRLVNYGNETSAIKRKLKKSLGQRKKDNLLKRNDDLNNRLIPKTVRELEAVS
jgi:hypothetical protein